MLDQTKKGLIAIFLVTAGIRLICAFLVPNFSYESYFHLRQVESITQTGLPIFSDDLSYGGRLLRFLPLFHYVMAFFALFLPLELAAKLIPNLFIASLTILAYLISIKITDNRDGSLLAALITGILPLLYFTNSFSPETLFLPLVFLVIYSFLNLEHKKYQYLYLSSFLALSLTSSAALLLIVGFLIYLLFSFLENKKPSSSELELMFFSAVFFIWLQFLFFKEVLALEGIRFIWQNIPPSIIQQYFPKFSLIQTLLLIGIVPFLGGIMVVYQSIFQSKDPKMLLLISLVISAGFFSWLRLVKFRFSLALFGVVLSILFASFYQNLYRFFLRSKLSDFKKGLPQYVGILLVITMIFSAIGVALNQETPSDSDVAAFKWIKENLPEQAKVAALIEEGHLITYYGKKKNVMDDNFYLISDSEERFTDLNSIFTTPLQIYAIDLFDKYKINYIMFTEKARARFSSVNFKFITVGCYERLYKDEVKIYGVKCSLSEQSGS